MKYTLEERLYIGQQIYNDKISIRAATEEYDICTNCVRSYMRLYRDFYDLPPKVKRNPWAKLAQTQITGNSFKTHHGGLSEKCKKMIGAIKRLAKHRSKKHGMSNNCRASLAAKLGVTGPMQCIVSGIRYFHAEGKYYKVTLYVDIWSGKIISQTLSLVSSTRMIKLSGYDELYNLRKQYPDLKGILFTDQTAVYLSDSIATKKPKKHDRLAGTLLSTADLAPIINWFSTDVYGNFPLMIEENCVEHRIMEYINNYNIRALRIAE